MQTKFIKRRSNNPRFKKKVHWYLLGQRRCHCCGVQLNWIPGHKNSASVEHMVPASKGGTFDCVNILIVCHSCNMTRRDTDWIKWVTENKFPKSEWLLQKYVIAMNFYIDNSFPISRLTKGTFCVHMSKSS